MNSTAIKSVVTKSIAGVIAGLALALVVPSVTPPAETSHGYSVASAAGTQIARTDPGGGGGTSGGGGGPKEIKSQTSIGSLQDIPSAILTLLFGFLPGVATLYLILTGYRYIVAQGNQELTEKAKKSLTYAVYGVIIAYASAAIILLFAKALDFRVAL